MAVHCARCGLETGDDGGVAPGTLVDGRYRVIGPLGEGGFGQVLRAEDVHLGRHVALKLATHAHAELGISAQTEAAALASIRHANVVGA